MTIFKNVPLNDEAVGILDDQRRKFVAKFGREPGPDEPIFFDAPPVEHLEAEMVQAVKKAGVAPALIYAFEKTGGLLVTEQTQHLISEADLDAWQAAINEYEALHRGQQSELASRGAAILFGPLLLYFHCELRIVPAQHLAENAASF